MPRTGRPKLPVSLSEVVQLRVTSAEKKRLARLAASKNMTVSAMLRELVLVAAGRAT